MSLLFRTPQITTLGISWIGPITPAKRTFVFEGATGSRLTLDWVAPILSPDQECRGNLRLLRGRGRELARNNPTAKHYLNLLSTNVVGDRRHPLPRPRTPDQRRARS